MKTPFGKIKTTVGAGIAAGLVLAVGIGAAGAIAAARALSPSQESQAVIEDAAKQLGVESSALSDALKQALENRVDAAVEAGRLTEAEGQQLKERIQSGEFPLLGGLGHLGMGFGHGPFGPLGGLDTAASFLGLTEAELRTQLADGKTLAEIAEAEGKSVGGLVGALVDAAEEKIDAAVEAGRLTEERAADIEEDLQERIRDLVNGELRPMGFGRHHGPGFGFDRHAPFKGPGA